MHVFVLVHALYNNILFVFHFVLMRLKGNNETVGWLVYGMTVFLLYFIALAKKNPIKRKYELGAQPI